jgi:hypothetical protein
MSIHRLGRTLGVALVLFTVMACNGGTADPGAAAEAEGERSAALADNCPDYLDGCYKSCQAGEPSPVGSCFENCDRCFSTCLSGKDQPASCGGALLVY